MIPRHNAPTRNLLEPQNEPSQWSDGIGPSEIPDELPTIIELMRRHSGIDFSGYKTSTLTRRLHQRMALGIAATPAACLQLL